MTYTDFHMHVLPGIDDGSPDVETSLAMLEASAAQRIGTVVASSHFYASENSPTSFLKKREVAWQMLREAIAGRRNLPRVLLGAEVYFFNGIGTTADLEALCVQGTDLLLLEMPFSAWNGRMLDEVARIVARGIVPVCAHIDRYIPLQSKGILREFYSTGIRLQANADFFLSRSSRKAFRMLKDGEISYLGSDAHNTGSRAPNLGPALELIQKKTGRPAPALLRGGGVIEEDEW